MTFRPYDWVREKPLTYHVYACGTGRARGKLERRHEYRTVCMCEREFRWEGKIGVKVLGCGSNLILGFDILSGGSRPNKISEIRGEPVVIQDEFVLMPLLIPLGQSLIGMHIRTTIPRWPCLRNRSHLEEGYRPEELLPPDCFAHLRA